MTSLEESLRQIAIIRDNIEATVDEFEQSFTLQVQDLDESKRELRRKVKSKDFKDDLLKFSETLPHFKDKHEMVYDGTWYRCNNCRGFIFEHGISEEKLRIEGASDKILDHLSTFELPTLNRSTKGWVYNLKDPEKRRVWKGVKEKVPPNAV